MRWSEVESHQPRLAASLGRRRLLAPVVLVVTIRRRLRSLSSPVEPFTTWTGPLVVHDVAVGRPRPAPAIRASSLHSVITNRDGGEGEFSARGTPRQRRPAERRSPTSCH